MKTRITELLGIKHPIIQSPMTNVSYPSLVAAACNAGALGILSGGDDPERLRKMIKQTRELTNKPFGVNFIAYIPTGDEARDTQTREGVAAIQQVLVEEKVAVASYGRGDPKSIVDRTRPHGIINIPTIGAIHHGVRVQGYGVDAVIIQGLEAGGHASFVSTLVQVPQVVDALKIPVVAAGGFCDDRGLVAALALGAEGIAMGTRFLITKESPVPDNIKQRYLAASDHDTILTPYGTGVRCRALQTKGTDILEEKRELPPSQPYMKIALEDGDADGGFMPCGQVVGRINNIPSCKELIERIIYGAEEILERIESKIRAG